MQKMKLALGSAIALALAPAIHAFGASPITFAQFQEATGPGNANLFSYFAAVLDPPSAVTGLSGVLQAQRVPVIFTYDSLPGLPPDLRGPQQATLTLTSATNQTIVSGFGGLVDEELFNVPAVDVLTITRDAAVGAGSMTNLLTMTFTGQLIASPGGGTAVLTGQTALGYVVNYSSDFLDLGGSSVSDYSVNFTSWTSGDGGQVEPGPMGLFFNPAQAAATGSFDAVVPEPGTLALAAFAGVPMILRRRRRVTH